MFLFPMYDDEINCIVDSGQYGDYFTVQGLF